MSDLMERLYDFVLDRRMGSVHEDPEYAQASHSVELQWKKLQQLLEPQQQKELSLLLEGISAQNSVENEHLFQAALGLARELGRTAGTV